MSGVALVQFSSLNLQEYLTIGRQGLDINLAESADSAGHEPPLHHMLCVAAIKNPSARNAEDVKPYLDMFHAGFLVAADERYWAEILEIAAMPCVVAPCIERGVNMGVISGTLSQWANATLRGCQKEVSREARHTYNLVYSKFRNLGLAPAFSFKSKPNSRDHTFLLEYQP